MKTISIKRSEDIFDPKNLLLGTRIYPGHATRYNESMFYGLTVDEANKLKEFIPEGTITGVHELFVSRQFKFPSELPSGLLFWDDGTVELWVEYASKRFSVVIPNEMIRSKIKE